ncbi:TetR/AcrR family transcriptional regulator [Persephonella sp.]
MSQSTRDKLIISAIKVFSEKGFYNTKVSDIVQEAGVAQGTFYIYFKSKEEIFLRIVQLIVSNMVNIIDKYYDLEDKPSRTIKLFARDIFKIMYEYKEIAYIFFFQVICVGSQFQDVYFDTSDKIKQFYLKKLENRPDKEILSEILIGYGKRLVEFGMLRENKPYLKIVDEFEKAVDLLIGD